VAAQQRGPFLHGPQPPAGRPVATIGTVLGRLRETSAVVLDAAPGSVRRKAQLDEEVVRPGVPDGVAYPSRSMEKIWMRM
jgi:hypothetical protein